MDKKKRILVFTYRTLSKTGGVETYLCNLIDHLDYQKFDLSLLMPEASGDKSVFNQPIKLIEYKRESVRFSNFLGFINPFIRLIRLYKNTKDILLKENPDIIVTREYLTAVSARLVFRNVPIVFLPGSLANLDMIFNQVDGGNLTTKLLDNLNRYSVSILEWLAFLCSTKIIVSSDLLKGDIHKLYNTKISKIAKIPIGVSLEKFQPITKQVETKNGKRTVLSVSRLSKSKNVRKIIEVAEKLDDSYVWIMVGNGEEYDWMKEEVNRKQFQDKVLLVGEKKDPIEYYNICDVFVHLSYYENFGQVLLESMVCGNPPIVLNPNLKGVKTASGEIIQDGYNGYFVENNPEKIAEKIRQITESDHNIRENCIRTVRENYTFDKHLQGLYRLIDDIA